VRTEFPKYEEFAEHQKMLGFYLMNHLVQKYCDGCKYRMSREAEEMGTEIWCMNDFSDIVFSGENFYCKRREK